jgi:hypothetical protein
MVDKTTVLNSDSLDISNLKTYIHEDKEVVMTGRFAKRIKHRKGRADIVEILIEICPLSAYAKNNKLYNSWVKKSELFHIIEDENEIT